MNVSPQAGHHAKTKWSIALFDSQRRPQKFVTAQLAHDLLGIEPFWLTDDDEPIVGACLAPSGLKPEVHHVLPTVLPSPLLSDPTVVDSDAPVIAINKIQRPVVYIDPDTHERVTDNDAELALSVSLSGNISDSDSAVLGTHVVAIRNVLLSSYLPRVIRVIQEVRKLKSGLFPWLTARLSLSDGDYDLTISEVAWERPSAVELAKFFTYQRRELLYHVSSTLVHLSDTRDTAFYAIPGLPLRCCMPELTGIDVYLALGLADRHNLGTSNISLTPIRPVGTTSPVLV